jgi:hypothetical protein
MDRNLFADLHIATSPGGREVFDGFGAFRSEARFTSSSWRRPCAWQAPSSSRRSSPSLPSSPCCPPSQSLVAVSISTYANRRHCILDYYSRKKKNIFHVKEMCAENVRAHPCSDSQQLAPA